MMKNSKLTFSDFQLDTVSKKEQQTIRGGEYKDPNDVDPGKTNGNGNP